MAGIGFALRKLSNRDNLASRSLAGGHAILISSGPWIVIMAGLALLHALGQPLIAPEELKVFSILVIYSFALSLVITAPTSLEATLRVSRVMFQRHFEEVQGVYLGALFVTTILSVLGSIVVFLLIVRLPRRAGAGGHGLCDSGLPSLAGHGLRCRHQAIRSGDPGIRAGSDCSIVFGTSMASLGHGPGGMLLGFSFGLCIAFGILNYLILSTFPGRLLPFWQSLGRLKMLRPSRTPSC
jgi:uncharacterized membrane protein